MIYSASSMLNIFHSHVLYGESQSVSSSQLLLTFLHRCELLCEKLAVEVMVRLFSRA